MAEYSRLARGSFTSAGTSQVINLPFQPTHVNLTNYTAFSAPAQYSVTRAFWDIAMGQGVAAFDYIEASSSPWITAVDYTTSGITTFSAGQLLQYGPKIQIVSATAANPIVFTVSANTYNVGDVVVFEGLYQSSTTGMPQICGMPFIVSAATSTTFSVVWPGAGSNYTALSSSPTGAYVQKVLYPYLYEPGTAFIEAISLGTTTTVTTTAPHNFTVGQEIAFRIPASWGTTQLNSLPNTTTPGSPIYYYVTSVTSNTQFVCNANSTGYTAFNTNQTVASVPGLTFPQVVAVGDVNTGGVQYSGGKLYPSPVIPTYSGNSTINGPAIQGSYINNTSQGFTIQNGAGAVASSATLLGTSQLIIWEAYLYDFG